jgi:hypothetical protein
MPIFSQNLILLIQQLLLFLIFSTIVLFPYSTTLNLHSISIQQLTTKMEHPKDNDVALYTQSGKKIVHLPIHYGRYARENSTLPGQKKYQ